MPKVSVILPNYNHEKYLDQRIFTVLGQSFSDIEIILLDDASTDLSVKLLEKYRSHPVVSVLDVNAENGGSPFKQWEKGIRQAIGEYIWIAETDDFCDSGFLESAISVFNKYPEIDLYYTQSLRVDEEGNVIGDYYYFTEEIIEYDWRKDFIIDGNKFIKTVLSRKNAIINASAVIFRKNKVKFSLKPLIKYKTSGDWLFWVNYLQDASLYYCATPMNYFRDHQLSTRTLNTWEKMAVKELEGISIKKYLVSSLAMDFLIPTIEHEIRMLIFKTPSYKIFKLNKMSLSILDRRIVSPIHVILSRVKNFILIPFKLFRKALNINDCD